MHFRRYSNQVIAYAAILRTRCDLHDREIRPNTRLIYKTECRIIAALDFPDHRLSIPETVRIIDMDSKSRRAIFLARLARLEIVPAEVKVLVSAKPCGA